MRPDRKLINLHTSFVHFVRPPKDEEIAEHAILGGDTDGIGAGPQDTPNPGTTFQDGPITEVSDRKIFPKASIPSGRLVLTAHPSGSITVNNNIQVKVIEIRGGTNITIRIKPNALSGSGLQNDLPPDELIDLIAKLPEKLIARDKSQAISPLNDSAKYEINIEYCQDGVAFLEAVRSIDGNEEENQFLAVAMDRDKDTKKFEEWFKKKYDGYEIPDLEVVGTPNIESCFRKLEPDTSLNKVCKDLTLRVATLRVELRKSQANPGLVDALNDRLEKAQGELKLEKEKARIIAAEILELKSRIDPFEKFLDDLHFIVREVQTIPVFYDEYLKSQCEGLTKYYLFDSTCSKSAKERFLKAKGNLQGKVASISRLVQTKITDKREKLILDLTLKDFDISLQEALRSISMKNISNDSKEEEYKAIAEAIRARQTKNCGFSPEQLRAALRNIISVTRQMSDVSNRLCTDSEYELDTEKLMFSGDSVAGAAFINKMINEPDFLDGFMISFKDSKSQISQVKERIKSFEKTS